MDGRPEFPVMEVSFGALDPVSWPAWLLWLLAAYGVVLLLYGLWEHARELFTPRRGDPSVSVLVVTRNQEQVIEGVLRELVARYGSPAPAGTPVAPASGAGSHEIIVVDDSSTDDTPLIAERLARDYPGFIRVTRALDPAGGRSVSRPGRDDPVGRGAALSRGGAVVLMDLRRAGRVPFNPWRGRPGPHHRQEDMRP